MIPVSLYRSAALLAAVLIAAPAQATRPTYSYLEFQYLDSTHEANGGAKTEADGGRFNFNVSLANWMYFTGEYNHADFDDSDQQQRDTSLGFGAHTLHRGLQFFTAATYERSDVFGTDATDEGYAAQFGLRWPVLADLELGADVKFYDYGDGIRQDRHRGTLAWRLGPTWSAVGTYQALDLPGEIQKSWTLGFRAYFITQYDLPPRRAANP